MPVRFEYRKRFDSQAAAYQAAQEEAEQERRADIKRLAQAAEQEQQHNGHNGSPPWAADLADHEAVRQAAMVAAPPSRDPNGYGYSAPQLRADQIRLTAEQASVARQCGIPYETYAANLIEMETRKRRGDLQQ